MEIAQRLTECKTMNPTGQSHRMNWVTAKAELTKTNHDHRLTNTSLSRRQEHRSSLPIQGRVFWLASA